MSNPGCWIYGSLPSPAGARCDRRPDAVEVWRQQQPEVHALDHAPNILLIMLGRFERCGRRVRKLRHVIDILTRLRIPTFSRHQHSSGEYTLLAGAIHVGGQAHRPLSCIQHLLAARGLLAAGIVDETTILSADGDFFIHETMRVLFPTAWLIFSC